VKVDVASQLDCSAVKAWNEVQKSSLLLRVIWPLARLVPVSPASFPDRWSEGLTIACKVFVFGLVPIGVRTLRFEKIDKDNYEIRIREHDPLVRRWDHLISIKPHGENRSIYRDVIDIDAGGLTFLVWAWTSWFYRHRQRRWRALAKML
jgi:hypothetical protein